MAGELMEEGYARIDIPLPSKDCKDKAYIGYSNNYDFIILETPKEGVSIN